MNNYALVAYLPDPLRKFLDDLRRELVPGCAPHAHVTILPPRPLSGTPDAAIETMRSGIAEFSPFEVKIADVEVFAASDVVYLGIGAGHQNLAQMHGALDAGPLKYEEPYPYHPHITLAQDLTHQQSIELGALARLPLVRVSRTQKRFRSNHWYSFRTPLGNCGWTWPASSSPPRLPFAAEAYCSSNSPI